MSRSDHEIKVEALLEIIAQAQVASFAFNVSRIPDNQVTVKSNSTTMAVELATRLDEIIND